MSLFSRKKGETNEDNPKKDLRYIKFGIAIVIYLLWTLWVGSFWLLLGIPVLFDIYITKKVNWTPWKKRYEKNSTVVEWIDALIFAVVAVTLINIFFFQNYKIPTGSMEKTLLIGDHLYVTKLKYGPKMPNTPIAFPFTQSTLPLTKSTKSYVDWPNWGYKRLAGFTHIKNDDIVVFNFPEGDTVVVDMSTQSYYAIVRNFAEQFKLRDANGGVAPKTKDEYTGIARKYVLENYETKVRPVDRQDNYIKRCVAIAGDSLRIINGQVYINGKAQRKLEDKQYRYLVTTDGSRINPQAFERLAIYASDVKEDTNGYEIFLTDENLAKIKGFANVKSVEPIFIPSGKFMEDIFPHSPNYPWNVDNFGPLWIPKKGATVKLTIDNLCMFERIISAYEGNKLEVKDGKIFINGQVATSYTFKMDYYFMMGDNRHDSADSRYWGFVPEDHIVGAPRFVWLSLDPTKSFPANIRWRRFFTGASN